MIFVFQDDDETVEVIDDTHQDFIALLNRNFEVEDVKDGEYFFFNDKGEEMIPVFDEKKYLFGFVTQLHGYKLVPGKVQIQNFMQRLNLTTEVEDNPWYKDIEEIKQLLKNKS